jgi:hypothetical protein
MGRTPDRRPGEALEEKLVLQDEGLTADNPGEMVYRAGAFSFRDAVGILNPRSGSFNVDDILIDDITGEPLVDDVTHNLLVNQ